MKTINLMMLLIILSVSIVGCSNNDEISNRDAKRIIRQSSENQEIVLYTGEGCRYCDQIKTFLKEERINFVEKEVWLNKTNRIIYVEHLKMLGLEKQSVPLLIFNDVQYFIGYSENIKKEILEMK